MRVLTTLVLALALMVQPASAAHEKTWKFLHNVASPGAVAATNANYAIWQLMNTILANTGATGLTWTNADGSSPATPTSGWSLYASSNGSGVGACNVSIADGGACTVSATNLINANTFTTGDFVHAAAGANHTWLAFVHSGPEGYKIVLDLDSATAFNFTIKAGFGTFGVASKTTAPAMSVTSTVVSNTAVNDNSATSWKQHSALASDGSIQFLVSKDGSGTFYRYFVYNILTDTASWDSYSAFVFSNAAGVAPAATIADNTATNGFSRGGRICTNVGFPSETGLGGTVGTSTYITEPDPSGNAFKMKRYITCRDDTLGRRDYKGRLADWFTAHDNRADGDVTPTGPTPEYMVYGSWWFVTNAVPSL